MKANEVGRELSTAVQWSHLWEEYIPLASICGITWYNRLHADQIQLHLQAQICDIIADTKQQAS